MRYFVSFVLFLVALGTLRIVGCGEEGPAPEPCESASDCDDQNACTDNRCHYETKTCTYVPIECRDWECESFEFDTCDPNAPDGEVCGAVTIHEGRSCGDGLCLYPDPDCQFPPFCTYYTGSYQCSVYEKPPFDDVSFGGACICQ